jgi:hypothetical protein
MVLLGGVQVVGLVEGISRIPTKVGLAAVADRDLGKKGVEGRVEDRRGEEAQVVGERGEDRSQGDDGDPRPLVEVPLDVELNAVARRTPVDRAPLSEGCREGELGRPPA